MRSIVLALVVCTVAVGCSSSQDRSGPGVGNPDGLVSGSGAMTPGGDSEGCIQPSSDDPNSGAIVLLISVGDQVDEEIDSYSDEDKKCLPHAIESDPRLPVGLEVVLTDENTVARIRGRATEASPSTDYAITASSNDDSVTISINIRVQHASDGNAEGCIQPASGRGNNGAIVLLTTGESATTEIEAYSDAENCLPESVQVSPRLPAGLAVKLSSDKKRLELSGAPTKTSEQKEYSFTVRGNGASYVTKVTIGVRATGSN